MDRFTARLPDPAARDVLILANRRAGPRSRGNLLERTIKLLEHRGMAVRLTWDIEPLVEQVAKLAHAGRLRAVVAAGGDGTASLVANSLPPSTPLAILPLGTENLLARYLDIRPSATDVCRAIAAGVTVHLDAGRANGRMFLLMAGFGFDAEVVRRLHEVRRGNIDYLSYAKPLLHALRNYRYPVVRLHCMRPDVVELPPSEAKRVEPHGAVVTVRAKWAFVVNLPRYALGLGIAPRASGTDGLLDVCTFREGWWWHSLRYLGGVVLRRHETFDDCVTLRTRRVRIEADERVPYQLDGDPAGYLPVEIEVLPQRLTLLVSARWAHAQGFRLAHAGEDG